MRVLVVTVVHTPLDARIHRRQIGAMVEAGWSVTYAARGGHRHPARGRGPGVVTHDLPRAVGRRRLAALRAARRLIAEQAPRHDLVVVHDPELLLALGRPPDGPRSCSTSTRTSPRASSTVRGSRGCCGGWPPGAPGCWSGAPSGGCTCCSPRRPTPSRFRRPHPVVRNLPPLPPDPPPPGRDRVVYVGRLSRGRGVEELLELARRLGPAGPRVELVGQADDDVRAELDAAVADGTLVWHGWLPNDDAFELLTGALAGLSLLRDLPNYRISLPTKVVEYLAAGLPVVTTPLPAAAALVREADAGIVVDFGDVAAAAAAVRRLRDDPQGAAAMGRRGRELVARDWTWDAEREVFLDALTSAAGSAA
jgi:glycosyltransferase involved in cell wall biosynthesis